MGRRMPHRLTVQANSPTTDAIGQEKDSWSDERTVWGRVVPIGGDTRYHQGREVGAQTRFVELVYDPNNVLDVTKRLKWSPPAGTRYLYPEYIQNQGERDQMIVVRCKEQENG